MIHMNGRIYIKLAWIFVIAFLAGCAYTLYRTGTSDQYAAGSSVHSASETDAVSAGQEKNDPEDTDSSEPCHKVGFLNIDDSDPCCYLAKMNFIDYVESDEFAQSVGGSVQVISADSANDLEKQTTACETMLVQDVEMMFIIGVDTEGNTTAVKECNEADVPVFMVGTEAAEGDWKAVGFDEYAVGFMQGRWCINNLPEGTCICYMEGTVGRETTIRREAGFREALKRRKDLQIISSQSGDFDTATAQRVTEDWINAYEDRIGCIVTADSKMMIGVCEALKAYRMTSDVITCGVISIGTEDGYPVRDGICSYAVYTDWPAVGTLCGKVCENVLRFGRASVQGKTYSMLENVTAVTWDAVIGDD